jgi:hypothetical protein
MGRHSVAIGRRGLVLALAFWQPQLPQSAHLGELW